MKYSIVLPVRNGGNYVKECIHSILSQTYTGFNLIVLDSGSTDATIDWIESLQDSRIIIHHTDKPLTIEQNWSRIKDVPRNEFMTMIGYDDILWPNYLQEMDALIAKHPNASLYQTHFHYINETGALIKPSLPMDEVQQAHEFLACQMARTIDSTGTGYMMRSADYNDTGGMSPHYPNLIFSDFELWMRLMLKGYKACSVNTCFSYRIHQSVSRVTNGMLYQQAFVSYIRFITRLREQNEKIKTVVDRHGKDFMLYYAESLSHRLLKTPLEKRTIKVTDLLATCRELAAQFIPGQEFDPLSQPRTKLAQHLDSSSFSRFLFNTAKKLGLGK